MSSTSTVDTGLFGLLFSIFLRLGCTTPITSGISFSLLDLFENLQYEITQTFSKTKIMYYNANSKDIGYLEIFGFDLVFE